MSEPLNSLCGTYYTQIIDILNEVSKTNPLNISEHKINDYVYIIITPNTQGYIVEIIAYQGYLRTTDGVTAVCDLDRENGPCGEGPYQFVLENGNWNIISTPASHEYWDMRLKELPVLNDVLIDVPAVVSNDMQILTSVSPVLYTDIDCPPPHLYKVTKNPNNEPGETEMTLEEMDTILQAQQTAIDRASYDAVVARLPTSYNLMNIEQTNQMKTAYETYFLNDEKTKNLTIALLIGGLLTTGVILLVRK